MLLLPQLLQLAGVKHGQALAASLALKPGAQALANVFNLLHAGEEDKDATIGELGVDLDDLAHNLSCETSKQSEHVG